jgi:DNA-binding LytR/AlgR family response regulator
MFSVLLIEDERPAIENLAHQLQQIDPLITISATLESVKDSIRWLSDNKTPDLIFMDVQLTDGLSFNIFKSCRINSPVVFTTAYDEYIMQAFEHNAIDYILKPIDGVKLAGAIAKYKSLQKHFVENYSSLVNYLQESDKKRKRILVKRGVEFQSVRVEDIVYFFTEHKLVFLVDKDNKKYLAEKSNLTELAEELDGHTFYRVNRKFIVNVNFIKKFRPLEKSKISVELTLPLNEEIIVSQENAGTFKRWMSEI